MFREELMLFVSYICHLADENKGEELSHALPSMQRVTEAFESDPEDEVVASLVLKILQCTSFKIEKELVSKMLSTILFSSKRWAKSDFEIDKRTKEILEDAIKSLIFQFSIEGALSFIIEKLSTQSLQDLQEQTWLRIRFIKILRFFTSEKLDENSVIDLIQSSNFSDFLMLSMQSPEERERASMITVSLYLQLLLISSYSADSPYHQNQSLISTLNCSKLHFYMNQCYYETFLFEFYGTWLLLGLRLATLCYLICLLW